MILYILLTFLLILSIKKWLYWTKWDHLPGYSAWCSFPLVGHAYILGNDPVQKLAELYKKFGPIFRFDIGSLPSIIICDYDDASKAYKVENVM